MNKKKYFSMLIIFCSFFLVALIPFLQIFHWNKSTFNSLKVNEFSIKAKEDNEISNISIKNSSLNVTITFFSKYNSEKELYFEIYDLTNNPSNELYSGTKVANPGKNVWELNNILNTIYNKGNDIYTYFLPETKYHIAISPNDDRENKDEIIFITHDITHLIDMRITFDSKYMPGHEEPHDMKTSTTFYVGKSLGLSEAELHFEMLIFIKIDQHHKQY